MVPFVVVVHALNEFGNGHEAGQREEVHVLRQLRLVGVKALIDVVAHDLGLQLLGLAVVMTLVHHLPRVGTQVLEEVNVHQLHRIGLVNLGSRQSVFVADPRLVLEVFVEESVEELVCIEIGVSAEQLLPHFFFLHSNVCQVLVLSSCHVDDLLHRLARFGCCHVCSNTEIVGQLRDLLDA